MIAFLAVTGAAGIIAVFVLVMRLEDHLDRKAPRPPARSPAAGATRVGGRALPTARPLPGATPQLDHEWLAAPTVVPGRESPPPPIPVGDSAPVSSVAAGAARPAGD